MSSLAHVRNWMGYLHANYPLQFGLITQDQTTQASGTDVLCSEYRVPEPAIQQQPWLT